MIIFENYIDNDDNTARMYSLKNMMLVSNYWFSSQKDDSNIAKNAFVEETLDKGCKTETVKNKLWIKECYSETNKSPLIYTYTSYKYDGNILQYKKSKIIKKDSKNI